MPDKQPQFTVTDRRKFTLDGDLRDEENQAPEAERTSPPPPAAASSASATATASPAPAEVSQALHQDFAGFEQDADDALAAEDAAIPDPTAEESAQQSADYQSSSRQLDDMLREANPAAAPTGPMNFDRLVQSIYMTAAVQMGAGTPPNEQPRIDILGARQSIDMLSVLEEKTRGNLTDSEKRLLQNALFDLRMSFLEITNAIASSAAQQRPGQGPGQRPAQGPQRTGKPR